MSRPLHVNVFVAVEGKRCGASSANRTRCAPSGIASKRLDRQSANLDIGQPVGVVMGFEPSDASESLTRRLPLASFTSAEFRFPETYEQLLLARVKARSDLPRASGAT